MSKAEVCELGDLIEFQRGYDLPKSDFVVGPYPVQSSNGVLGYHNEFKVKGPGITIGRSGTVGIPHLIEGDFFPHNTVLFIKDFKGNDVKYIYYLLKNLRLGDKKSGSGVPTMNRNHLHPFKVKTFRDIDYQNKLSSVLNAIDKKIDLNNKINTELEAMAKLIYDYWFVQFDFPDENGKPYKSSGGKMVYNKALKHEIPEGWSPNTLAEFIESDKTGDWGKDSEHGNYTLQVDCIRGTDINSLNGKGKVKAPNRYILQKNKHKILSPFDLVIEISGGSPTQSTGRMTFLTPDTLERFRYPIICSNFCKAISLKNNIYFYNFIYQWNAIYDNGILFGWEGKTSGIKNLLFDSFVDKYPVCFPPESLAKSFSDFIEPLHQKKQKSLKENSELEQLRDWLLPMLMNGQVTVNEPSD